VFKTKKKGPAAAERKTTNSKKEQMAHHGKKKVATILTELPAERRWTKAHGEERRNKGGTRIF